MTTTQIPDNSVSAATSPPRTAAEVLDRATALAVHLRERSAEIERERHLPPDVVAALRDAGVFRMGFPRGWGGPDLTSMEQTEVVEVLSRADASVGWCAMIGADSGLYAAFLEESAARAMFTSLDMATAGLLFPVGRAERVPGGYRLSGRWQLASGITHCDWVASGAMIYRDGRPEPGPVDDTQDKRIMMVRRTQVEIIDTWHTTGLAGSGSCDYTMADVFVPEEHTFRFDVPRSRTGPLAQPEAFMRNMPGVPLGVARAALDHVRDAVTARVDPGSGVRWADDYRVQVVLADCEADFLAARSAVYSTMARQWEALSSPGATVAGLTAQERAEPALARLHAFRVARSIVARLYDLMQTAAIYRSSPVDRWLRDTTTMCQHVAAQERILQSAGAHLLGARPAFPLCLGIVR